ncbi:MAG: hypothetical protein M1821_005103 [Bathelium mastoideum]|nr:MAG: hypothetical protein M1821_005103 [Bathelium mastoideum]
MNNYKIGETSKIGSEANSGVTAADEGHTNGPDEGYDGAPSPTRLQMDQNNNQKSEDVAKLPEKSKNDGSITMNGDPTVSVTGYKTSAKSTTIHKSLLAEEASFAVDDNKYTAFKLARQSGEAVLVGPNGSPITLSVDGPAATIDNRRISLENNGIVIEGGSKIGTIAWSTIAETALPAQVSSLVSSLKAVPEHMTTIPMPTENPSTKISENTSMIIDTGASRAQSNLKQFATLKAWIWGWNCWLTVEIMTFFAIF